MLYREVDDSVVFSSHASLVPSPCTDSVWHSVTFCHYCSQAGAVSGSRYSRVAVSVPDQPCAVSTGHALSRTLRQKLRSFVSPLCNPGLPYFFTSLEGPGLGQPDRTVVIPLASFGGQQHPVASLFNLQAAFGLDLWMHEHGQELERQSAKMAVRRWEQS